MVALGAPHAGAAGPGVADFHAFPHVHSADAHGAHQAFVPGEADDVGAELVELHVHHARGLGDVQDEGDAPLPAGPPDLLHGLDGADDIRAMVDHGGPGVGFEQPDEGVGIDVAPVVEIQPVHLDALFLEVP